METFVQQIINGLVLGSVYALVALGYTMVYGIINLINFAHGEVLMVGALTSWTVVTVLAGLGLPGWALLSTRNLRAWRAWSWSTRPCPDPGAVRILRNCRGTSIPCGSCARARMQKACARSVPPGRMSRGSCARSGCIRATSVQ